ncbi:MAG: MFS transporter [Alphaproteobacteria bacterium]|nr:MFS transporter [Alphaproteobacteria bacterium]MDP6515555.1 MFS transporter [Alphaproteobacteria bacterium]
MNRHAAAWTLAFSSIAHAYAHLFVLLYATVVLVLEGRWGLSYAELFALSIPMSVMFGAAALPAGWLADHWSGPGMIAAFFIGVGASSIATGLADSPFGIGVGLTAIGIFAAIYHPVAIPWLVRSATNPGRTLGINGVFGSAGTAGAALVAGSLAAYFGWRAAFIVPGALCLATGAVFLVAWRIGLISEAPARGRPQPRPEAGDAKRVFLVLAVTVISSGLIYQVTSFALPKIFAERIAGAFDDSVVGIAGMVTLVYGIGAVAQIIGGEFADRFRLKTIFMITQLFQIPALAAGFILFNPVLVVAAAMMVSLNVAGQPAENALLARYVPARWQARAFGAKFVLALGVSAVGVAMIPIVHGLTGSLDSLFLGMIGLSGLAFLAASMLPSGAPLEEAVEQPIAAE